MEKSFAFLLILHCYIHITDLIICGTKHYTHQLFTELITCGLSHDQVPFADEHKGV